MTTITITGAGGSINYEFEVVLKALQEAGIEVMINNEYRHKNPETLVAVIYDRLTNPDWSNHPKLKGCITKKVMLSAVHLPWGG